MLNKVGIFTKADYVTSYMDLLAQEGYDCEFEACTDILPSWKSQLNVWDARGFDICIIDDAQFAEKDAMLEGIVSFMNSARAEGGHLRIIFFSSSERTHDDPVFVTLAHSGVFDFVIPQGADEDLKCLVSLIRCGNRRGDVGTYLAVKPQEQKSAYVLRRAGATIAVASFSPRAGVTTTAFTLARTIILAYRAKGKTGRDMPAVGVGVDEEFFQSLAFAYKDKFDPVYGVFRVNGMLIFNSTSPKAIPHCEFLVLDLGMLELQKKFGSHAGNERFTAFLNADVRVVCVPYTNYIEAENTRRVFSQLDPKFFSSLNIAFWGIKDEFFSKMKEALQTRAPGCYLWKMPVSLWPIDRNEIDPDTLRVLYYVLPRGYTKIVEDDEKLDESENKPAASETTQHKKRGRFLKRKGNT